MSRIAQAHLAGADRWEWVPAALLIGLLCFLPVYYSPESLCYDEAYMLQEYVSKPWRHIATTYDLPNNHIGLSLLLRAWATTFFPGLLEQPTFQTWLFRLPVVFLSVIGTLAFFFAARRLVSPSPWLAALTTVVMAAVPELLWHSFQVRGYAPAAACFSVILWTVVYADVLGFAAAVPVAGLFLFFAEYLVPTSFWFTLPLFVGMTLYLAAQSDAPDSLEIAPWRLLIRRRNLWIGVTLLAAAGIAGFAVYLPVLKAMTASMGRPLSLADRLVGHGRGALDGVRMTPWVWLNVGLWVSGIASVLAARRLSVEARRTTFLILPVVVLPPVLAVALFPPAFPRNYTPASPFLAIVAMWGVLGPARWVVGALEKAGASAPVRRAVSYALPMLLAATTLTTGWLHVSRFCARHRPADAVRLLAANLGPDMFAVSDMECDYLAVQLYSRAARIRPPIFFEQLPRDLIRRGRDLLLLTGSPESRERMLTHLNLKTAEAAARLTDIGRAGDMRVERYTAQPRNRE